jgi:transposase
MWVPPEDKDPVLRMAPTRKSMALFGAVHLREGRLVTQLEKTFNAITFQDFLANLLSHRQRERKTVVILDNAKYHHAKVLRPFLEVHRDRLVLEFLPSYSPELNPIERVWKLTRRLCTHNTYFDQIEHLTETVTRQLSLWAAPNETLRRLCCVT